LFSQGGAHKEEWEILLLAAAARGYIRLSCLFYDSNQWMAHFFFRWVSYAASLLYKHIILRFGNKQTLLEQKGFKGSLFGQVFSIKSISVISGFVQGQPQRSLYKRFLFISLRVVVYHFLKTF